MDHSDSLHPELPQMVYLLSSFVVVRSADIDYVMSKGFIEKLGPGKQSHHRDLILLGKRDILRSGRRSNKESGGKNLVFLKAGEARRRLFRIVAVIVVG